MSISKQDLMQLFQAADLNPELEDIKSYLNGLDFPLDDETAELIGIDLFDLFWEHNRAVWVDWKARYDEVSKKVNKILADWGSEVNLPAEEIKEADETHQTFEVIIEFINENEKDIRAVYFDTWEDSAASIFFRRDKLANLKNPNVLWAIGCMN